MVNMTIPERKDLLVPAFIIAGAVFLLTIPKIQMFAIFYLISLIVSVLFLTVWTGTKTPMEDIGWKLYRPEKPEMSYYSVIIGSFLGLSFVLFATHMKTTIFVPGAIMFSSMSPMLAAIGPSADYALNTLVVAPAEENFFRGFLRKVFMISIGGNYGRYIAIVLQALLFSAFHMNAWGLNSIAAYGMGLTFGIINGILVSKIGLIGTTAIHATWNNAIIAYTLGISSAGLVAMAIPLAVYLPIVYWRSKIVK